MNGFRAFCDGAPIVVFRSAKERTLFRGAKGDNGANWSGNSRWSSRFSVLAAR